MKMLALVSLFFSSLAFANISLEGDEAKYVWDTVQAIDSIEKANIIYNENGNETFRLDNIDCAFEMYYGCSFYVNNPKGRKLLIVVDGAQDFMNELAGAGVYVDTQLARMDVDYLNCLKQDNQYFCDIVEPSKH